MHDINMSLRYLFMFLFQYLRNDTSMLIDEDDCTFDMVGTN